jgi:hypothetical protein
MCNVKAWTKIAFRSTAAFFLTLLAAASYLNDTADASLIARYAFDGNADDSSGNGLHGTVNGATLAPDRFGVANRAFSFNGSGDHIEVPDSPLFAFGDNPYSFSFWFNLGDVDTYGSFGKKCPTC